MTTKTSGGKITGLLALTCEAQEALDVGDWVQLVGDYEVELADGTKPVLGKCSVSNKKRVSSVLGTSVGNANVPGDVTIETPAFWVSTEVAAADVTAGQEVAITANGLVPFGAAAASEVNRITITATGGTYTITYAGQTTSALAYNASAATIDTALEALSNIGVGDVTVAGTGATRTITAATALADLDLTDMTVDDALATGGDVTIETVTQGQAAASNRNLIVGTALTSATEGDEFDLAAR
jgi:hypothetical protein